MLVRYGLVCPYSHGQNFLAETIGIPTGSSVQFSGRLFFRDVSDCQIYPPIFDLINQAQETPWHHGWRSGLITDLENKLQFKTHHTIIEALGFQRSNGLGEEHDAAFVRQLHKILGEDLWLAPSSPFCTIENVVASKRWAPQFMRIRGLRQAVKDFHMRGARP